MKYAKGFKSLKKLSAKKHLKKRWKVYAHLTGHTAGAGHAYLLGRSHGDPFRNLEREVKKAVKGGNV